MNNHIQVHQAHMANVERVKMAVQHTIREMEASLEQAPPMTDELLDHTTFALRGRIRVVVQGFRALLRAIIHARRARYSVDAVAKLDKCVTESIELFALLSESLD